MPLMQYKAVDSSGKTTLGRMDAVNSIDLEMRLGRMGLDLITYKEARTRSLRRGGAKVKRRDLITFCFHLEQLISSGVPLLDGLVDLRDSVDDSRLREVVAGMIESIEGGKTLSESMAEVPGVFDHVFVNLVHAGELTGKVDEVLRKITDNLKWEDEQAELLKRLLTYPALVSVTVAGALVFLMTYLVPQLVQFVASMGEELPYHTKLLFAVSGFFVEYWYLIVSGMVVVYMGVSLGKRVSPSFSYFLDNSKLRVWVIGPILKKMILARFSSYFALMYSSGITVLECIRVSEGLVGNRAIAAATRSAGQKIAEGESISAGFAHTGLFPPLVLRMLRVGENTGALDTALLNISYFYERDVKESIERMQSMIIPAMTVILGGLLFWVIVSVLGPIYDLIVTIDF